jgi:hypothetical protein
MNKIFIEALKKSFDMKTEDAVNLAKTVEKIFDGKTEVEDMSIDKYSRALFYELQRQQLLKIRREEVKEEGKQLRKFYWSFDKIKIKEKASMKEYEEDFTIYKKIPKNAWLVRLNN